MNKYTWTDAAGKRILLKFAEHVKGDIGCSYWSLVERLLTEEGYDPKMYAGKLFVQMANSGLAKALPWIAESAFRELLSLQRAVRGVQRAESVLRNLVLPPSDEGREPEEDPVAEPAPENTDP